MSLQTTISNLKTLQKVMQMGRKHCGKRRNCSLRAISPFPIVFSKGLFAWGVKRCHCVGSKHINLLASTLWIKVMTSHARLANESRARSLRGSIHQHYTCVFIQQECSHHYFQNAKAK